MTALHRDESFKNTETVELEFSVTDRSGNAVDLSGAVITYSLSRKPGSERLVELDGDDEEITVNTGQGKVTVAYPASYIQEEGDQAYGDFWDNLTIDKEDKIRVAAEGRIIIKHAV